LTTSRVPLRFTSRTRGNTATTLTCQGGYTKARSGRAWAENQWGHLLVAMIVLSRVQTVAVTARIWPCKRWFPVKVSPPSTSIQYPLVPLSLSNMSSPFVNMITPEIPFLWVNNTLFDEEGYPVPLSNSVGYAQPWMIPMPILTDLVNPVSPLEYQKFTHISMSQDVRNVGHFGNLPSGGITFPGIDATNVTVLPISSICQPDLEIDFRGLETASV
jgi:hypothetical protein